MKDSETVFRSADPSAQEDAAAVLELLTSQGISGDLVDDTTPGVPAGVWEVRVEAKDTAEAEALVAANPFDEDEFANVNESHDLDLVTVFHSAGNKSEMEAMSVKGILDAAGIYAMIVGDPRFSNLPEEVRVQREHLTDAKRVIADALTAGAAAADEAEGRRTVESAQEHPRESDEYHEGRRRSRSPCSHDVGRDSSSMRTSRIALPMPEDELNCAFCEVGAARFGVPCTLLDVVSRN